MSERPFAEAWAEEACDQIDASLFSSDAFYSADALERLEWYFGRWQRRIIEIRDELAHQAPAETAPPPPPLGPVPLEPDPVST